VSDARPAAVGALLALTFVTGVIDAASVLGLGHVFVANMTGNVVFVGFALAGMGNASLTAGLLALGAFLLGAALGGRLTRGGARMRQLAFASELVLITLASGLVLFLPSEATSTYLTVSCLALAMGLRNAVVRAMGVADLTTTVLTLTLTGIAADSSLAGGSNVRLARRLAGVAAMLAGALAGALLLARAPTLVIVLAAAIEGIAMLALVTPSLAQPA
jgi:uncharacterized membrane protein YoaK (UPF0700 family)